MSSKIVTSLHDPTCTCDRCLLVDIWSRIPTLVAAGVSAARATSNETRWVEGAPTEPGYFVMEFVTGGLMLAAFDDLMGPAGRIKRHFRFTL